MSYPILELLAGYLEKQDLLSKLTEKEFLHGYGHSEIHFIDAIGILDTPNIAKITNYLKVTRGAVSRMAKKQIAHNSIESYTAEGNRKEIYFRLTKKGEELLNEHKKDMNSGYIVILNFSSDIQKIGFLKFALFLRILMST